MPTAIRYDAQISFDQIDSRTLALAGIAKGSRVLDIGVGNGEVARTLNAMGCRAWGVEYDHAIAAVASDAYEELVVADVETLDFKNAFPDTRFDVVLLLDVLEHLVNPRDVLRRVPELLTEDGYVCISLPNVTHAALKLQLLGGHFSYTDEGLLDKTHLRFFDIEHVHSLVEEAGLVVLDLDRVIRQVDETEVIVDLDAIPDEILKTALAHPESLTFQFVLTAAPAGSRLIDKAPLVPAKVLQNQVRALQDELMNFRRPANRRSLNPDTLNWVEDTLQHLRNRSDSHRRAILDLVNEFQVTIQDLREQLSGGNGS